LLEFLGQLDFFSRGAIFALLQVILIDIVLAGDNAIVIGMSAAHVEKADRRNVIFWGLAAAVVLRILLAIFAVQLLHFIPLVIAGGILLLWVAWRLWRDVYNANKERQASRLLAGDSGHEHPHARHDIHPPSRTHGEVVRRAIVSIIVADISMSLDNVLAVAGAAREHVEVLVVGLALSIALMGLAASLIARLLNKYPWISYAGIFIVLFVAMRMIWEGFERLHAAGQLEQIARYLSLV
jgi:YjbE family integral membrane protein